MNRTLMSLLIKFIINLFAAWITLGLFAGNSAGPVFAIALASTAVNYIVGELFILTGFGNMIASLGDGILGALVAFLTGMFFEGYRANFFIYFLYALLIVVAEFIFHVYLQKSEKTVQ